ncbi:MAG: hypothetical protein H0T78_07485, partial [Longispora sp.]|nr:hypothetical protein [Longispora sp. (in: high G+C Gram-positive bacteria)]
MAESLDRYPTRPSEDSPDSHRDVRNSIVAQRAQFAGLAACVVLLPVLMYRFLGFFRSAVADKLPDASAGQLDVAAWAAWAMGWLFNAVGYIALVLILGALSAACCRWLSAKADFRGLRLASGAVLASYLAARVGVFIGLSLSGVGERTLLSWLSDPEPSLLLLAAALTVVLRRTAPELSWARAAGSAVV